MFISVEFFKNFFLITCFFTKERNGDDDDGGDEDDGGDVLDESQKL